MGTAIAGVSFSFRLPARFSKEGRYIVGVFPHLDIASQGETIEEARANLIEAARLFIESCFDRNVLDDVLKSCGFRMEESDEVEAPAGTEHLSIPFELVSRAAIVAS